MEDQGKRHLAPSASKVGKTDGAPLPAPLKHEFEASFGSDLSQVRVHESHAPTHLGAKAFAHGSDIFFAPGEYQPHTDVGRKLLAHELTHVVQQGGGTSPVDSPSNDPEH